MINLNKYFYLIFDAPRISDNDMRTFAHDHLYRLIANNDSGEYDDMVEAMVNAYDKYFGAITDEDTSTALREGRTKTVDRHIDEFLRLVRRREPLVRSVFDKGTQEYEEFYTHGLAEFTNANKANIEILMKRLADASIKYTAQLGQNFANECQLAYDTYTQARNLQITQKGIVSNDKSKSSETRNVIERQLNINLLQLAENFLGEPEKCKIFFTQSLLPKFSGSGSSAGGSGKKTVISLTTDQTTLQTVELGIKGPTGKKITIHWGDDNKLDVTLDDTTQFFNHDYAQQGTYNMEIRGISKKFIEEIHSNNSRLIKAVIQGLIKPVIIILQNNNLDEDSVNNLLIEADESGVEGGTINLLNSAAPTGNGLIAKSNLIAKEWVVLTSQ